MRLMHARICGRLQSHARQASRSHCRRSASRTQRQPLPLRNLCRNPRRGRTGRPEGSLTMQDYQWPDAEHRTLIGKRIARVDSPDKVSGQARYTYDIKRPGMLFGKMLRSPYAHCKVVSIDISAAEKMPGVKAIESVAKAGSKNHREGDEVVAGAAVDEP